MMTFWLLVQNGGVRPLLLLHWQGLNLLWLPMCVVGGPKDHGQI